MCKLGMLYSLTAGCGDEALSFLSIPFTHTSFPIYLLLYGLLEVVDDLLRDVDEPGPPPRTPGDITEVDEGGGNW